ALPRHGPADQPRGMKPARPATARPNPRCLVPIGDRGLRGEAIVMKHTASRELYAYWQEKRGAGPAPARTDIQAGAIRAVLPDAFILALDRGAGHPIRLAGTRMCALFGREIKGESFLDLWDLTNRPTMEDLLSILSDECTGTVAGATGQNENGEL